MTDLDRTHDPELMAWLEAAQGHRDFPIQNLPFGVFSPTGGQPRGGVAIGDHILDLAALASAGLLEGDALQAARAASGPTLNPLMALGAKPRTALRRRLVELLETTSPFRAQIEPLLVEAATCALHLPAAIGDYTDFYAGIHHALAVGRLFRPDNPLLPNYKHLPIGYHGRASSVAVSGAPVRRPRGQSKPAGAEDPIFGPTKNLDYELELGVWIGPGNPIGHPIPLSDARAHIFGVCLLNDWSARDFQAWEAQPLGPFLAKNFTTSVSPWIVTAEALAPFRRPQQPRPADDPSPLAYLQDTGDQHDGAFDIAFEVLLATADGAPQRLSASHATDLYWTLAQLVTHHTSGGCNLNPGDLIGSGTISGETADNCGSLLELTQNGRQPITLASGETRRFLEDGDELILRGRCERPGFVGIGLGECRATILPALADL